jgi:helicase required for RNAi-mediated heterochromatin assembly 1
MSVMALKALLSNIIIGDPPIIIICQTNHALD